MLGNREPLNAADVSERLKEELEREDQVAGVDGDDEDEDSLEFEGTFPNLINC